MTVLSYLLACVCAYLFFCGISIDPEARATVSVGNPMWGFSRSIEDVRDPTFRLFGVGGLVWAATLILLSRYNANYCSFQPGTLLSLNALMGILTTVVTAKVLFGPIMRVRKSVRLVGEQQYDRPVSFMLYDAIRVWPSNLLEKFAWKLLVVGSIATVIWLLSWMWDRSSDDVIPAPLAYAWILACLGRAGTFVVDCRPPRSFQLMLYALTVVVTGVMWSVVEAMLNACGAAAGALPSYETLAASIIGLPLAEAMVTMLAAIF